ncbi:M48 family metalloprotease [Bacillus chungangensis]|uniref:Aminopeptidase n=1 Tax=Bacillus chungangensis TaxID=587633 RepID=A0ABT9WYE1_9BACI|nr:aminopeptidase [Bacillus chungangensis]MDQ0178316.1 hypothetical protein [Bacillus chungangensis]
MKIINIIPDFLDIFHSTKNLTYHDLSMYYEKNAEIFNAYFPQHCKNNPERIGKAIKQYPAKMEEIEIISTQLPRTIKEISDAYSELFHFEVPIKFHLFVGGFGSNAFTDRKLVSDVYFAAEKLSIHPNHLSVIVAHEIGHVYHRVFSDKNSIDWDSVKWSSGEISLFLEGVATYLSKKIVRNVSETTYYSYDDSGQATLNFYQSKKNVIKKNFLDDCLVWDHSKLKEWFTLSGGNYYNETRLGYYLGMDFVESLAKSIGDEKAILAWKERNFEDILHLWLLSRPLIQVEQNINSF